MLRQKPKKVTSQSAPAVMSVDPSMRILLVKNIHFSQQTVSPTFSDGRLVTDMTQQLSYWTVAKRANYF